MYEKVSGYRKLIGLTQDEVAKELNISVQAYRNKEKGRTLFNDKEKLIFKQIINEKIDHVSIDEIFFSEWLRKVESE